MRAVLFCCAVVLCCTATFSVEMKPEHEHGHSHTKHQDFSSIISGLPPGFVFGTATAAYQIEGAVNEGGRGATIWDTFCHLDAPTIANNATGDVACDSYHRYEEDAALAQAAGFTSYRMSIAWSRIYPEGDGSAPNEEGIQHYHNVLDAFISMGLEPIVTLYHWDLPQALEDKYGGWLSPEIVPAFEAYADTCFREFGGKVKKWITTNEAWSFVHHGYSSGMHAPGRCTDRMICAEGDSFTEPYLAAHNVILAHAHAVSLYRSKYKLEQGGVIGMTLNLDWAEPLDPDSKEDKEAAARGAEFQMGWFADPIYFGDYPPSMRDRVGERLPTFTDEEKALVLGSSDFLGFNHYTTWYVTDMPDENPSRAGNTATKANKAGITLPVSMLDDGWAQDMGLIQTKLDLSGKINGMVTASTWLTGSPPGMRKALKWASDRYGRPPIMITENGMDRKDEWKMTLEDALQDDDRIEFYEGYLRNMVDAIVEDGVDVRAYYTWSLLDNFEWSDGYRPRFGLTYVDYDNSQDRYPKDSSKWFARLSEAHQKAAASGKDMGCVACRNSLSGEDGDRSSVSFGAGGGLSSTVGLAVFLMGGFVILLLVGLVSYKIGTGSWRKHVGVRRGGYDGV